jgi:hypothetical protein
MDGRQRRLRSDGEVKCGLGSVSCRSSALIRCREVNTAKSMQGLGKMLAPGKMLGLGKMLRPSGTTTVIEYCEGPWSRFFLFAPTKKLHYSL